MALRASAFVRHQVNATLRELPDRYADALVNVDFVVARVCDQLGVEHRLLKRWGERTG